MLKFITIFSLILLGGCSLPTNSKEIDVVDQEIIQIATPTPTPSNLDSYLQVSDQKSGRSVNIGTVAANGRNFVVIFRSTDNDAYAEIVGSSQPIISSQTDFNIILSKPVFAGDKLSAVLFSDDGDSIYNPELDIIVVDRDGNNVQANFNIL